MTYALEAEYIQGLNIDYETLFHQSVDVTLEYLHCPYETCVNLLLTDDAGILAINRDMRNLAVVTDVLSFPMNTFQKEGDFSFLEDAQDAFDPDTGELLLGDIVLSTEQVLKNAGDYGHSVEREYSFLIVHSMLHLTGFDHIEESDRIRMEEAQKAIMQIIGISR
ncbi:MAG: rRNA maturation RNase YbeY [Lachnospiraceae bacterium]|nr:rRNA maturation RNase YbeY [Lachnospiraceae bacterium]MCR4685366.1 rRNA maturation RNase YbeY [Lachnospiraceae bacterium]